MCSRPFETWSRPRFLAATHRGFAFCVAFPKSSIRPLGFAHPCRSRPRGSIHSLLPSQFYLDHSHCPVLAPATLAALPSTRAIETRSLPTSLAATHRGFAFYVALPKSSIPSIATCSMSLIPSSSIVLIRGNHEPFNRLALNESIETRSLPSLARCYPRQLYLLCC
jgi:hypothetical protein